MSFEKEIGSPLASLAAIEAGPDIIKDVVGDWGGVGLEEVENTNLGKVLEGGTEAIQNLATPAATLFIVGAGLGYMLKGFEGKK